MIALLLKSKKVHLFIIGFLMIGNILFFQNCSNKQYISPNLLTNASNETSSDALMPVLPTPVLTGTTKSVFMATGHMGRTVMSCDDGKSWINDRSENDNARCWSASTDPNYVECDHTPYSGRGKTGSLDTVVSMAGFAGRKNGDIYTFTFLYNGPRDETIVREAFDQVLISLLK